MAHSLGLYGEDTLKQGYCWAFYHESTFTECVKITCVSTKGITVSTGESLFVWVEGRRKNYFGHSTHISTPQAKQYVSFARDQFGTDARRYKGFRPNTHKEDLKELIQNNEQLSKNVEQLKKEKEEIQKYHEQLREEKEEVHKKNEQLQQEKEEIHKKK